MILTLNKSIKRDSIELSKESLIYLILATSLYILVYILVL